jgi:hypothetical protein
MKERTVMVPSIERSEVAYLIWSIQRNCEALQRVMNDPCYSVSHRAINRRYQVLGSLEDRLAIFVGPQEATDVMYNIYNRVLNQSAAAASAQSGESASDS